MRFTTLAHFSIALRLSVDNLKAFVHIQHPLLYSFRKKFLPASANLWTKKERKKEEDFLCKLFLKRILLLTTLTISCSPREALEIFFFADLIIELCSILRPCNAQQVDTECRRPIQSWRNYCTLRIIGTAKKKSKEKVKG